jgi:hypothetical protein
MPQRFFLCSLGDERNPFCILTAVETDGGGLETAAQFSRPLAMASGSSDGRLVTRIG